MCIAGGSIQGLTHEPGRGGLAARSSLAPFAAHQHVFYEGDERACVYIVESGWVKLYRTLIDGQRQIVGFANAGSILGLEGEAEHVNGCETITPVTMRVMPVSGITQVCLTDGKFAEQLMRQVGRQLSAAQAQLATIGAQSAEQKIASFLLSIADLCDAAHGAEFDLPMRRGDMAEFLGLRLETVSRKMSDFQRRSWITMTTLYHCRLQRRDILEELAAGGDPCEASLHGHRVLALGA